MYSLRFWENWEPGIRRLFVLFGTLMCILILAFLVSVWRSPAPSITWSYFQERELFDKPVHQFQTGPFSLQVSGDNTILHERLVGNEFIFQAWPAYIFLFTAFVGLTILCAIVSTFSRFWFFICSGILIFLLSGLQLELLNVLGQTNQSAATFVIILIVGTGVLFQFYFQSQTIVKRLMVYGVVIVCSFTTLLLLAQVPNPAYLMSVGFIPSMVAGSVILAVLVAHEIIGLIVRLVTRGLRGSNVLMHFTILTSIYLLNLIATYLNDQNYLHWDYSLNPIILLMASGLIAIWGIQQQQEQKENFILDGPTGPLTIIGFLIIASGSSFFFYTTANDAAVETIRNLSLYCHIGYGVIFFLYIIANFGALLKENYPVSKVLYKPKNMPYFTFRLAGTITVTGFILYNFYLRPLRDTTGARDVAMGDYYVLTNDLKLAEGYYKKSNDYAFHNHHANYVLGDIESARRNVLEERQYYLNAAERRPTQQAYMNIINTLEDNPLSVYAYLRDMRTDFPYSGVSNNTMGKVYSDLQLLDSATLFYNLARKDALTESTAEINMLAMAHKYNLPLNLDSINQKIDQDHLGSLVNLFALANKNEYKIKREVSIPSDSVLNVFSASLLSNYLLNHIDSLDTAFVSHVDRVARISKNSGYKDDLLATCALAYYQSGLINKAFSVMQEATVYSEYPGKRNNVMALWALDLDAPEVALGYALYSGNQNYDQALLTQAISLTEMQRRGEALVLFDSIQNTSKELAPLAESLQRILVINSNGVKDLNDLEKYAYCRYRLSYSDYDEFVKIVETIDNPNWKARAVFDRSKKLYDWDQINESIEMFNRLSGISISDKTLFNDIQLHELMLAAATASVDVIKAKIDQDIDWNNAKAKRLYLESFIAQSNGDTLTVKKNLDWISKHNSFFSEGVIAAASSQQNSSNPLAVYTILADALYRHPQSVRILKAYIVEAKRNGFDNYVSDATNTLQQILPPKLFERFVSSYQ